MFDDREMRAEGSVVQELCLFVIQTIRCLYTYFVKSTLKLSLDLFNTLKICYRYNEDVHKEKVYFDNLQGF